MKTRAVLYARVSTDEQARHGYSLRQQIERLREYCQERGIEVVEEITDPGQSGATLDRPGMDHVRDLVAAGGISVVLAQDRDRFAREPAYHYLLRREFEEYGTVLRALNDNGDGSPESELQQGILDQLAKFERAKMTERTRRGRLQRAREGKILPVGHPPYGFTYNADNTNYVVKEPEAAIVREIFERLACGASVRSVERDMTERGILSPGGSGRGWNRTIRYAVSRRTMYTKHTRRMSYKSWLMRECYPPVSYRGSIPHSLTVSSGQTQSVWSLHRMANASGARRQDRAPSG